MSISFAAQFETVCSGRRDSEALAELARLALDEGEEDRALPLLVRGTGTRSDARVWQWTGLLQRSVDAHDDALASFTQASRLAPADGGIAHGHARVALEAGCDAVALYEKALRLTPANGDLLIGLAAARFASGRGEEAAAELDAILVRAPAWVQGHRQLAQLYSVIGKRDRATSSIERALAAHPGQAELWRCLLDLRVASEEFETLSIDAERARIAGHRFHIEYSAIAAAELGDNDRADALFEIASAAFGNSFAVWRIRHLLRTMQIDAALALIDREFLGEHAAAIWPYAAAAWRVAGDSRASWLADDPRLVTVVDLPAVLPQLDELADVLRSLHVASGEYLGQSVRGGTQTDGPLLSHIDPVIRSVRLAVEQAVRDHIAQLPPSDPAHPSLMPRRDRRIRFGGSWSVRLRGSGFHANHVHPQGWISSALYVALPPPAQCGAPDAGWLTLGEPQAILGLNLGPTRLIEPRPGRLVLFPSWMWHGTRPFGEGERLTLAFDVAPPR